VPPPDMWEVAARFSLIIGGFVILIVGLAQIASVSRTTIHSETHNSTTVDSSPPPIATTVVSEARTSSDTKPDDRPSDTVLGIIFGVGAVLVIAGGYYNRKFEFVGPGGVTLKGEFVKEVVARTLALTGNRADAANLTPDDVGSIAAESLTTYYYPRVFGIPVPRLGVREVTAADLDALISRKIDAAVARNQPPAS
jgi:hypothetical protein